MENRRWSLATVLGLTLVFGSVACSSDDDGERANTESIDSSETAAETGDEGAGGDGEGPGEILGTARAQHPASALDERMVPLRIDLVRLDRNGDLVELDVVLVNEAEPPTDDSDPLGFTPNGLFAESVTDPRRDDYEVRYDSSAVGLVDGEAQKLYLPIYDSERVCLCTENVGSIDLQPGDEFHIVASYGGVPGDVDALDVRIPGFPTITGVPLG